MVEDASGFVFDVQRCSFDDGPGVRTVVFLKGCPLRCRWCHNPESLDPHPQPFGADDAGNPRTVGSEMTVDAVMDLALRDRRYYERTNGGLTISGGEPLFQPAFTAALIRRARGEGVSVCIETNGYVESSEQGIVAAAELLSTADLVLFDVKDTDPSRHEKETGAPLEPILEVLRRLADRGAPIRLRCPIIPGINDTEDHIRAVAALARRLPRAVGIDLLPFHNLCAEKYRQLGRYWAFEYTPPLSEARLRELKQLLLAP